MRTLPFLFVGERYVILVILFIFFSWLIYNYHSFITICVSVILGLTTVAWVFPLIAFFLSLIVSIFYLFLLMPYFVSNNRKLDVMLYVLRLLHSTGVLEYFHGLFVFVFCQQPRIFYKRLYIFGFITVVLNIITKAYVLFAPSLNNSFSFLYLVLIFLFIVMNYIRFLIGLSYLFTLMAVNLIPDKVPSAILYIVTGDGSGGTPLPENTETSQTSNKRSYFSLFNIHKHQHTHFHHNRAIQLNNLFIWDFLLVLWVQYCSSSGSYPIYRFINNTPKTYLYAGLAIGAVGAIGSVIVAYDSIQQTKILREQLETSKKTLDKTLEDSGIITKTKYYERHPKDANNEKK